MHVVEIPCRPHNTVKRERLFYESETRGGGRGYALQPIHPSLFLSR
ncbi:hypothetical protein NC653_015918 [Populus alba x Populus x berolinensis]|uniref:Uncharacterized protein n=1 Tax=Populus alba x Populus x berolinensis TaxID=444605 RepID=A0AAD6VYM5_9ROSI|nr:hypothetical protein NC653_015918 [Populus alba x Populus x berolinensis]